MVNTGEQTYTFRSFNVDRAEQSTESGGRGLVVGVRHGRVERRCARTWPQASRSSRLLDRGALRAGPALPKTKALPCSCATRRRAWACSTGVVAGVGSGISHPRG